MSSLNLDKIGIFLLAAGEGRRLRPLTKILPKPCIPLLGKPLVSYAFDFIWRFLPSQLKPDEIIVNTFHLKDTLKSQFHEYFKNFHIIFSDEPELLGAGGAIHFAKRHLEKYSDFFIVNTDNVIFWKDAQDISRLIEKHRTAGSLATLLVTLHPEAGKNIPAVWWDKNSSQVLGFGKSSPQEDNALCLPSHYVGVCLLNKKIFQHLKPKIEGKVPEENILYDTLVKAMKAQESVLAFESRLTWYEAGDVASLNRTADLLDQMQRE